MIQKIGDFLKRIPSYMIIIIAIIITIPLAMNVVKVSKETSKQQEDMTKDEKVLIVAKSNYDVIIMALKEYPEDLSEKQMLQSGFIVINNRKFVGSGEKLWSSFCQKVRKKKNAAVILAQYTMEGDVILQYISYVNEHFYLVQDASRDQFGGGYDKYDYSYMKRFEENGTYKVVLTKDEGLVFSKLEKKRDIKDTNDIFEVKKIEKNK